MLILVSSLVWQACSLEMMGNTVVTMASTVEKRLKHHLALTDYMLEMKESILVQLGYSHRPGNIVERWGNN